MKVIEIEGKTPDDATKKGMAELGIEDAEKVTVEIIDQGRSGIFGFGVSKPAKVRIYYNDFVADVGNLARDVLLSILKKMNLSGEVKDIKEGESKVYIELESEKSSGLIIGRKGKTLEALQFIVNLIVNHKTGTEKKIILDIESYRANREKALRKLSREIAHKVIKSGRPWTLEPMNPFERRLIHMSLQNDKRVTTKSEGQGIYRKVTISPTAGE
ncbi:MAG TPA: RNA-binding cell elongation regulator Jag/EloR [Spirochaetota bacterium]|nr:RNA-binding cell elongation regulator Jag/EloR [Spirochaetota bacterium]HPI89550.1 RNA-binding cell elongation regulator Jag/EloR [Spirochaetota bacterium]HPR49014.1 RNA-binding cell elongation regulator Jag/EloR [Spirochaetota bacterium]